MNAFYDTSLDEPIAFALGHGETLIAHWYADGHALLRFQRAAEAKTPGTVVTGQDVEIDRDVPAVWLMFEDSAAVCRMRDYLDTVARGMTDAAVREDDL